MFGTMVILIALIIILSFISPFKNNRNTAPLSHENERGQNLHSFLLRPPSGKILLLEQK